MIGTLPSPESSRSRGAVGIDVTRGAAEILAVYLVVA